MADIAAVAKAGVPVHLVVLLAIVVVAVVLVIAANSKK
jgi:hypothetical protein